MRLATIINSKSRLISCSAKLSLVLSLLSSGVVFAGTCPESPVGAGLCLPSSLGKWIESPEASDFSSLSAYTQHKADLKSIDQITGYLYFNGTSPGVRNKIRINGCKSGRSKCSSQLFDLTWDVLNQWTHNRLKLPGTYSTSFKVAGETKKWSTEISKNDLTYLAAYARRVCLGYIPDASGVVNCRSFLNYFPKVGVTPVAGGNMPGALDSSESGVQLSSPKGMVVNSAGDLIFIDGDRIRQIGASNGRVTTIAGADGNTSCSGYGDGPNPMTACFHFASYWGGRSGIAVDAQDNIYVTDSFNSTFSQPLGVVRRIEKSGSSYINVKTLSAWGWETNPSGPMTFNSAWAIALDSSKNIYVSEQSDSDPIYVYYINSTNRIRKVTATGAAKGVQFRLDTPDSPFYKGGVSDMVAHSESGVDYIYFLDGGTQLFKTPTAGTSARPTQIPMPSHSGAAQSLDVASTGDIYYYVAAGHSDTFCYMCWLFPPFSAEVISQSGVYRLPPGGSPTATPVPMPFAPNGDRHINYKEPHFIGKIALDNSQNVYISSPYFPAIYKRTSTSTQLLAGLGGRLHEGLYGGWVDEYGSANIDTNVRGPLFSIQMAAITVDNSSNIYLADSASHIIRKINPSGFVTTIAGSGQIGYLDGAGASSQFYFPKGIDVDADGDGSLYVADYANNKIRKLTPPSLGTTSWAVSTVVSISSPYSVKWESGSLYVAQPGSNAISKITLSPSPTIQVIASGTPFDHPEDIAVYKSQDPPTHVLYVTDSSNQIRKIDLNNNNTVSVLAGSVDAGAIDDDGTKASFFGPSHLTLDPSGNIYLTDKGNQLIRKVTPSGRVTTLAGAPLISGYSEGSGASSRFRWPEGLARDPKTGDLIVGDVSNFKIRRIQFNR